MELTSLSSIRIEVKDEKPMEFKQNDLHWVTYFKEDRYSSSLWRWIPYIPDANTWYQHLLDVWDDYV